MIRKNKWHGLLRFYRQYLWLSLTMNIIFLVTFIRTEKNWSSLLSNLNLKFVLIGAICLIYNYYFSSRYYYYFNLGLTKKYLWQGSLAIDLLITTGMIVLTVLCC